MTKKPMKNESTNKAPFFKRIFGNDWEKLPPIFHKHYAPCPGTSDRITAHGHLDVRISPAVSIMARLTGALIPYSGENIPVTVCFYCSDDGKYFHFDRTFNFPDHGPCHFNSKMRHTTNNELIEYIKFGVGWRTTFHWDGAQVILTHQGYIWRLFGIHIPLPLEAILGSGYAEETAISSDRFKMWTHTKHPLFGETLYYGGEFEIKDQPCATTS